MNGKSDERNNKQRIDEEFEAFISKPEKTPSIVPDKNEYDELIVAVLDLLGITNEILRIEKDEKLHESSLIEKMISIKDMITEEIGENNIITMLYISDSFIFVCNKKNIVLLLQQLASIQFKILYTWKTLLRGAIEFGRVKVQDSGKQIIGPAFLKAYRRQEYEAIFPRILLGNSIINIIDTLYIENPEPHNNIKNIYLTTRDGEKSLDYIECYMDTEYKNENHIKSILIEYDICKFLSDNYNEYNRNEEMKIRDKYAWTIKYLREKGVWVNGDNECEDW